MTAAQREKLNRLFQIRAEQKLLLEEKLELMNELGYGTWRSLDFPGIKLMIQRASWTNGISWLHVAQDLARKFGMSQERLKEIADNNRTRTRRNKRVAFAIDRVKNPKVLPI